MRLHQTKQLCATNEGINKVKRQPTEWGKIIVLNYISDKELISKLYKEQFNSIQFNSKKKNNPQNNPIKNGQRTNIDTFLKMI